MAGYDGSLKFDTRLDSGGFEKGSKEIVKAINGLRHVVYELGESLENTILSMGNTTNVVVRQSNAAAGAVGRATRSVRAQVFSLEAAVGQVEGAVDKMSLTANMAANGSAKAMKNFDEEMIKTRAEIDLAKEKLQQFGDVRIETPEMAKLNEQITAAKMSLNDMMVNGAHVDTISEAQAALDGLIAKRRELIASDLAYVWQRDTEGFMSASNAIQEQEYRLQELNNVVASVREQKMMETQKHYENTQAIVQETQAVEELDNVAGTAKQSVWSKMSEGMENAKASAANLGKVLKRLILYSLGIRSTYRLFRKIVNFIKTGFTNLAKYSDGTADAISNIKNAAGGLQNQFAAAFEPILTVVAPILTNLINLLSTALEYITMFFAVLGGKSTYTKAKKSQEKFNESVGGGTAALKEEKRVLAGFDDLNILSADKSSGGGGGGSGSKSGADMFEELDLPINAVTNFAEALKGYIDEGDWSGLASYLGDKLFEAWDLGLDALQRIPWREKFNTMWTVIADFLFETDEDGNNGVSKVSSRAAETVGTLAGILAGFVTEAVDVATPYIEQALSDANDIWANSESWSGVAEAWDSFINTEVYTRENFDALGNLATTFSNWFWDSLLETFVRPAGWINDNIIQPFAQGFAQAFTGEVGGDIKQVYTGDVSITQELFGESLGLDTSGTMTGVRKSAEQISDTFWKGVGESMLKKVKDTKFWQEFVEPLYDTLTQALGVDDGKMSSKENNKLKVTGGLLVAGIFAGILEKFGAGSVIGEIGSILGNLIDALERIFGIHSPAKEMKPTGKYIGEGILEGMAEPFLKVISWVSTNVFQPIIDAVSSVFGLNAKSNKNSDFYKAGSSTGDTLLSGFGDKFSNLVSWVNENVFSKIGSAVSSVFGIGKGAKSAGLSAEGAALGGNLLDGLAGKFKNITTWVGTNILEPIKTALAPGSASSNAELSVGVTLKKIGWNSLEEWTGASKMSITAGVALRKDGWSSLATFIGESVTIKVNLAKGNFRSVADWLGLNTAKAGSNSIGLATGGIVKHGIVSSLADVPHYAAGTTRAHGSVFVAGEAGAEIVGNINGRTEILNRSQIATAIYSAVTAGIAPSLNALGGALTSTMIASANAINMNLGRAYSTELAMANDIERIASSVAFVSPSIGYGSLPYSVARAANDPVAEAVISSNEELGSLLVNAIASAVTTIVGAMGRSGGGSVADSSYLVQQTIDEINRRTRVYGASPLMG